MHTISSVCVCVCEYVQRSLLRCVSTLFFKGICVLSVYVALVLVELMFTRRESETCASQTRSKSARLCLCIFFFVGGGLEAVGQRQQRFVSTAFSSAFSVFRKKTAKQRQQQAQKRENSTQVREVNTVEVFFFFFEVFCAHHHRANEHMHYTKCVYQHQRIHPPPLPLTHTRTHDLRLSPCHVGSRFFFFLMPPHPLTPPAASISTAAASPHAADQPARETSPPRRYCPPPHRRPLSAPVVAQ
jgi:hypothetical protein